MFGAERGTSHRQRTLEHRARPRVVALRQVHDGEVVHRLADERVVRTEPLLVDRERASIQLVGDVELRLLLVDDGEIVEDARDVGIVGLERALANGEGTFEQRLGLVEGARPLVQKTEVVQSLGHRRGTLAVRLRPDPDGAVVQRFRAA